MLFYFILILLSVFVMLLYFRVAAHFNIIDKPNGRSSHKHSTIRGGGIVFYIAVLFYFFISHFAYPYFFAGLTILAVVSFLDDIITISRKLRLFVQLSAVALLLYQVQFSLPFYYFIIALILATGLINTYNFMDGINGITAGYSFSILVFLFFINRRETFVDQNFIIAATIPVVVFAFFNFRNRARCFAGDIGSVSMAYMLILFALILIEKTGTYIFILLFSVYGVDSILTIVIRLIKKENIFISHRTHLYQYLANEMKLGHLKVTVIYMLLQTLINFILLTCYWQPAIVQWEISVLILVCLTGMYIAIRLYVLKKITNPSFDLIK